MSQFVHNGKLRYIYAKRPIRIGLCLRWQIHPIHFRPDVGEAVMRVERMIIAVVVSVLAVFAVGSTAVASADPDMTHNSVEMTHN
jgi:hypothetical protein